ncbi:MAG: hypothetical protein HOO67_00275 [Candidatus Peribacteraceae bacterium]|nr:hypothetical protein [Candidatus Peribacteraceae bacterium]
MSPAEVIAPIPVPERIDVTRPDEVQKIADWLRTYVIQLIEQSHLRGTADISVAPKPSKPDRRPEAAINDYTTKPGLNTVSADVVTAEQQFFCTHGVILPTTNFQDFGQVSDLETIVVRSGSLHFKIDSKLDIVGAGGIIRVEKGQRLEVQSTVPTDYTCFYGQSGRNHVEHALKL